MKPKNNKTTLILAIVLTIIALPLAVLSTYGHILYGKNTPTTCDIKLIGGVCYSCENKTGYCNYAYNYINDNKYALNYYQGSTNYLTFSNNYVFLMDSPTTFDYRKTIEYPKTIIYDKQTGKKLKVAGLNNYGIGLNGNYYIGLTDTGKYTLFIINQTIKRVFDEEYDFIGVANHIIDNKLDSSKLVVLKDNKWKIIDINNNALTTEFNNSIYDYNSNVIAFYKDNKYFLSDYQDNNLLGMYFDKVSFYQDIIVLISSNNLYVYDSATSKYLLSNISLDSLDDVKIEEETDSIIISISGLKKAQVYFDGRLTNFN